MRVSYSPCHQIHSRGHELRKASPNLAPLPAHGCPHTGHGVPKRGFPPDRDPARSLPLSRLNRPRDRGTVARGSRTPSRHRPEGAAPIRRHRPHTGPALQGTQGHGLGTFTARSKTKRIESAWYLLAHLLPFLKPPSSPPAVPQARVRSDWALPCLSLTATGGKDRKPFSGARDEDSSSLSRFPLPAPR